MNGKEYIASLFEKYFSVTAGTKELTESGKIMLKSFKEQYGSNGEEYFEKYVEEHPTIIAKIYTGKTITKEASEFDHISGEQYPGQELFDGDKVTQEKGTTNKFDTAIKLEDREHGNPAVKSNEAYKSSKPETDEVICEDLPEVKDQKKATNKPGETDAAVNPSKLNEVVLLDSIKDTPGGKPGHQTASSKDMFIYKIAEELSLDYNLDDFREKSLSGSRKAKEIQHLLDSGNFVEALDKIKKGRLMYIPDVRTVVDATIKKFVSEDNFSKLSTIFHQLNLDPKDYNLTEFYEDLGSNKESSTDITIYKKADAYSEGVSESLDNESIVKLLEKNLNNIIDYTSYQDYTNYLGGLRSSNKIDEHYYDKFRDAAGVALDKALSEEQPAEFIPSKTSKLVQKFDVVHKAALLENSDSLAAPTTISDQQHKDSVEPLEPINKSADPDQQAITNLAKHYGYSEDVPLISIEEAQKNLQDALTNSDKMGVDRAVVVIRNVNAYEQAKRELTGF